jgi:hypothetical protein
MTLEASSTVNSAIATESLAPESSSVDGAVAISTIDSSAIARIAGNADITVANGTTLDASNTIVSTLDATPDTAAFGASVGVSVLKAVTTAEIADAARVTTGSLSLDARTSTNVTITATAAMGGADEPEEGSQTQAYLDDPDRAEWLAPAKAAYRSPVPLRYLTLRQRPQRGFTQRTQPAWAAILR